MDKIYNSNIESIGLGKNKAEFLEVVYGYEEITGSESSTTGVISVQSHPTGSGLDDPVGLVLVSQSICIRPRTLVGNLYGGGNMFAQDDADNIGSHTMGDENYVVDNILQVGGGGFKIGDSLNINVGVYLHEEYGDREQQRVFVSKDIQLVLQHYLKSYNSNDRFSVTGKWVFKKVKMTKNAYLEKLAMRAYA